MASSVIGALRVTLGIDTAAFEQGISRAQKQLAKAGQRLTSVGKGMTAGITAPLAAFGGLTLKVAGDFEAGMNKVAAVSGATGDELQALRDQAKELGATTQFSASQAAEAMGFLSMAGFRANEVLGAMPGTLQLAAAAQMDLGTTADVVSNILSGYGMQVEELGRVNDVLVKAFTMSNTSLEQLGEAMKYAGPVASAAGVGFEEAAAALGMMGNAGIQASMAGTSLRGAISRILSPTKAMQTAMAEAGLSFTDAAGKLLPLDQIIQQLEPHADNAGLFMELFGQRAGPAMAALVSQGSDALREMTTELQNSAGTAERISAVQMQGFNGAMRELTSAFEGLQIAIAESGLIEWAAEAVKAVAAWVQEISRTNPELLKWGTIIAGLGAAMGPVVLVLGTLATGIAAVGLPIAGVIAGITALTAAVVAFWPEIKAAAEAVGQFLASVEEMSARAIESVRAMVEGMSEWFGNKFKSIVDGVRQKVESVTGFFANMYDAVVGNSWVPDMIDRIGAEFQRLDTVMVSSAKDATDRTETAFRGMGDRVGGVLKQLVEDGKVSFDQLIDLVDDFVSRLQKSGVFGGSGGIGGLFASGIGSLFGGGGGGVAVAAPASIGSIGTGIGFDPGTFGFANGGSFKVGGAGGTDSQLVAFRATPGEMVDVRTPGQQRGEGSVVNISMDARGAGPREVDILRQELQGLKRDLPDIIDGKVLGGRRRLGAYDTTFAR